MHNKDCKLLPMNAGRWCGTMFLGDGVPVYRKVTTMKRYNIFTAANQAAAEMRLQYDAPAEAQRLYFETDPFYIAKYLDPAEGEYRYAYTGCLGERIGLTWDEMMAYFVAMENDFREGKEDD